MFFHEKCHSLVAGERPQGHRASGTSAGGSKHFTVFKGKEASEFFSRQLKSVPPVKGGLVLASGEHLTATVGVASRMDKISDSNG